MRTFVLFWLAAASTAIYTHAYAALPATNLPPVIVEASRLDKTPMEIPAAVETIGREDIALAGVREAAALLEHSTGVFVRRLGGDNPALAQLSMRGYGENSFGRVLVCTDGEQLNNPDMSVPNLSQIPIAAIEKTEVLYGPQTVLHGDNASAGVINFISAAPDYEEKTTLQASGGSWSTFSSRASTRGGDEDALAAYWGNAAYTHSGGYRDNSGYDIYNISGGVRKDWLNDSWLRLSYFYSDADYELPGPLNRSTWHRAPKTSNTSEDLAGFSTYGLNLSGLGTLNDENTLRFAATASRRKIKAFYLSDYGNNSFAAEHIESDIYAYSFSPQFVNNAKLGKFENIFTLGLDFRLHTLRGSDDFTGSYVSHSKPAMERLKGGIFAQDEFFFTDELSLSLGSRQECAMARNERAAQKTRRDNLAAYEGALNYRPVEDTKIFAKLSRFYRNPFLDETPWYYNGAGVYMPQRILAPERGYSLDLGGDWLLTKQWELGAVAFATQTKNEIFYDAGKGSNVNSPDDVRRGGVECHALWQREKFAAVKLRYALTHSSFTEGAYDGKLVPLVPTHQLTLDARYHLTDEFLLRGSARYLSSQISGSDFANRYDKIPAFALFSVGCRHTFKSTWAKGFTIDAGIDNLFDKNYCAYSTYGSAYYPGAGRCYTLSIGYEF